MLIRAARSRRRILPVALWRSPAHALVPALLGAAGCRAATEPTVASMAGTYTLTRVAGTPVPAAITATSIVTTASDVTRTLHTDGTCSESGRFVVSYGGQPSTAPVTVAGTVMTCAWPLSGRTVTFRTGPSPSLPYGGYDATTTAVVAADGSLTEQGGGAPSGMHVYPRTYSR